MTMGAVLAAPQLGKWIRSIAAAAVLLPGMLSAQAGPYDRDHLTEVRITFQEADWRQQLDSLKRLGTKERLAATVQVDGKTYPGVGVRFKGNSSYNNPRAKGSLKLPLNLKADYTVKGQTFAPGVKTLKLSNVFQDPGFLREVLSYEIARKYMVAPRCNFAKVYINGEYIGLYNNTESVDEAFLSSRFGGYSGVLFKCDPEWSEVRPADDTCPEGDKSSLMYLGEDPACYKVWYEAETDEPGHWETLIRLTRVLREQPAEVDQLLNVDMTLWMHAFNAVLVNLDSYTGRLSHNYYLYRTPDGLLTPILWDMNISFGGFRYDGEKQGALTDEELQHFSLFSHYKTKNPKRPLITNLLAVPLWRKIYVGHCLTLLQENFANGEYLDYARRTSTYIDEAVRTDPHKFYSYEDFHRNLSHSVDMGTTNSIGLETLMKARTEYLLAHPLFKGDRPTVESPLHKLSADGKALVTASATHTQTLWLAYRRHPAEPFRMIEMYDDGRHGDGAPQDGRWGITVDQAAGAHYYLVAEGERLATTAPARASLEFFEIR